jgi:hypothetical protein
MPKIVISYRRSDSDAIAGRIRDRLANRYGGDDIFMDIDSIPLGTDFRKHVHGALSQSDMVIAVIGPKWLGARRGRVRIKEETDPVRIEIETALLVGTPIIPVLVDSATMPKPSDLPESLKDFSFLNAAEVGAGRDFHQHMDRLIRSMDEMLGLAPQPAGPSRRPVSRGRQLALAAVAGALLLAGAAAIGSAWLFWPARNAGPVVADRPVSPAPTTPVPPQRVPQPPPAPQPSPPAADPQPAAPAFTLTVRSAIYGENCPFNPDDKGKQDVTPIFTEFCKREPTGLCRYPVQAGVLGDPSQGCRKALRIRYTCSGGNVEITKEAFIAAEASGNYALLQCSGGDGAIRSSVEQGVDRAGSDYRNFWLSRPETKLCQDACLQDARCKAWTYVGPNVQGPSASCWLKSVVPVPANRDCCTSGVVR